MTTSLLKLAELTKAQCKALMTLPLPRDPDPARRLAGRTFGSLWRKSSKHWDAMLELEKKGIVERTVSRGETLWRPTKPYGLAVAASLRALAVEGGEG